MSQPQPEPLPLATPVRFLRKVGPQRAESFARLGVHTAGDLLEYFPRDHEFLPPVTALGELLPDAAGRRATVVGEILTQRYVARARPPRFELILSDGQEECRLIWFHGHYLRDQLRPGDRLAAWGKVSRYRESLQLVNPRWRKVEDLEDLDSLQRHGLAVYPASGELSSGQIAQVVQVNLEDLLAAAAEPYDQPFRSQRRLPTRREALAWIHQPPGAEHVAQARRRLAYDELFLLELAVALRREKLRRTQPACPLPLAAELDRRIRRRFPFLLTADQDRVIAEIAADMARAQPMNRLLQGDVGSGKTVVALYAALLAVGQHRQVALMAPTEILAEQHFLSLERYLHHSRVRRALLTGGLPSRQRTALLQQIRSGESDIVVGTQALLEKDVDFARLALVVVDEQHKFGVRQRQRLRGKDAAPHYLVMTATPIPRTLALTVFGDLDVSTIEHLPPGRRPITTRWYPPQRLPDAHEFMREKLRRGQQAYFVYPRVEELAGYEPTLFPDESSPPNAADAPGAGGGAPREPRSGYAAGPLKAAVAEHAVLQQQVFPDFRVGLLHGQMSRADKQRIMDDFRRRRLDVLVATVVIEVGVDVPNATIMVIEHADHFGLAQLHQLRGRIGRGTLPSYCLLFAEAPTEPAQRRLEILTQTTDGFRIAEEDLRLRGPGEFLGTAQHGLPELKVADLLRDTDLLRMAQRDAFEVAGRDPELSQPMHEVLRRTLHERFGENLLLADLA